MLVDNVNGINNINRNFVRSEGDFHTAGDGTRGGIAVVAVHGTAEGTTGVETAALAQVEKVVTSCVETHVLQTQGLDPLAGQVVTQVDVLEREGSLI